MIIYSISIDIDIKNENNINIDKYIKIMDDHTKIKAIMIYFNHWRKDELRAEKAINGIQKTILHLKEHEYICNDYDNRLYNSIKSLFHYYEDYHITIVYKILIDAFLKNIGGYFKFYEEYETIDEEEDDLLFDRKHSLENNLGELSIESLSVLYDDNFQIEHILSVDSIIALSPISQYD